MLSSKHPSASLTSLRNHAVLQFASMDRNGDGVVSKAEMEDRLSASPVAALHMAEIADGLPEPPHFTEQAWAPPSAPAAAQPPPPRPPPEPHHTDQDWAQPPDGYGYDAYHGYGAGHGAYPHDGYGYGGYADHGYECGAGHGGYTHDGYGYADAAYGDPAYGAGHGGYPRDDGYGYGGYADHGYYGHPHDGYSHEYARDEPGYMSHEEARWAEYGAPHMRLMPATYNPPPPPLHSAGQGSDAQQGPPAVATMAGATGTGVDAKEPIPPQPREEEPSPEPACEEARQLPTSETAGVEEPEAMGVQEAISDEKQCAMATAACQSVASAAKSRSPDQTSAPAPAPAPATKAPASCARHAEPSARTTAHRAASPRPSRGAAGAAAPPPAKAGAKLANGQPARPAPKPPAKAPFRPPPPRPAAPPRPPPPPRPPSQAATAPLQRPRPAPPFPQARVTSSAGRPPQTPPAKQIIFRPARRPQLPPLPREVFFYLRTRDGRGRRYPFDSDVDERRFLQVARLDPLDPGATEPRCTLHISPHAILGLDQPDELPSLPPAVLLTIPSGWSSQQQRPINPTVEPTEVVVSLAATAYGSESRVIVPLRTLPTEEQQGWSAEPLASARGGGLPRSQPPRKNGRMSPMPYDKASMDHAPLGWASL